MECAWQAGLECNLDLAPDLANRIVQARFAGTAGDIFGVSSGES
jgi:hypothetical protein